MQSLITLTVNTYFEQSLKAHKIRKVSGSCLQQRQGVGRHSGQQRKNQS